MDAHLHMPPPPPDESPGVAATALAVPRDDDRRREAGPSGGGVFGARLGLWRAAEYPAGEGRPVGPSNLLQTAVRQFRVRHRLDARFSFCAGTRPSGHSMTVSAPSSTRVTA